MAGRFARVPLAAAGARQLGARALRVLIAIASHAGTDGQAYPSLARIAEITGIDRRGLHREIAALVRAGLISIAHRHEKDGSTNLYTICFDDRVSSHPARGVVSGDDRVSSHPARGVVSGDDLTDRTDHLTDSAPRPARERAGHANGAGDPFEHFWQIYPSRGAHPNPKKPARLEFEALLRRGMDPAVIIRGAEKCRAAVERDGTDSRYIAQAVTFLRQERFNEYQQEPPPPPIRIGMI